MVLSSEARAGDFDFSGSFTYDNDVQAFDFSVGVTSTVTVFSSSWLYGEPGAGQPNGGFDPILAIWNMDTGGTLIYEQDDGGNVGSTLSNGVSYSHGTWDTYYTLTNLAAGNYQATIAQFNNFAVGTTLASGFTHDGNPNFTFDNNYGGATQPLFNGVWDSNDPRTANWAFHIINVGSATQVVPLPPAAFMGLGLLGGLGAFTWRRRRTAARTI